MDDFCRIQTYCLKDSLLKFWFFKKKSQKFHTFFFKNGKLIIKAAFFFKFCTSKSESTRKILSENVFCKFFSTDLILFNGGESMHVQTCTFDVNGLKW